LQNKIIFDSLNSLNKDKDKQS